MIGNLPDASGKVAWFPARLRVGIASLVGSLRLLDSDVLSDPR
jgi:hypothetical protein